MSAFRRLPGCTCKHVRPFTSFSTASDSASLASTSKLVQDHPAVPEVDEYNAFVSRQLQTHQHGTGPLTGLRVSIKDNFVTADGTATTCASRILAGHLSPFEATVVKLLRKDGARIVGKTNMDEFGMGSHGMYSAYGHTKNPLDPSKVSGGSSSGAAASVAAGYCDVAIGSDTGGSVRLPASYTGTLGFKPSYGLLSRHGLVAYASSLDTVGIIARKAEDAAKVFDSLNAHDADDPTSIRPRHRKVCRKEEKADRLRIGIPVQCFPFELSEAAIRPLRTALQVLRSKADVEIVSVSIPSITKTLSAYYTIASAEASSNLARYSGTFFGMRSEDNVQGTRSDGFGGEVKKRIILGTYALTADAFDNYFLAAQTLRQQLKSEMDSIFAHPNPLRASWNAADDDSSPGDGVDILLFPSAISEAPSLEGNTTQSNGVNSYVQDVLTVPASLAGLPAASCPVRSSEEASGKLPIGVQVVGQWGDDQLVLQVATLLQAA